MDKVILKACAKVNLALDVLRKREDGYHDVRMIMQSLDICDELTFSIVGDGDKITIEANRQNIPTDERNLVAKAIRLMFKEYGVHADIHVKLVKNIPVEAGMAGGSTDGAAALKAVNMLFDLGADEKRLMELGVWLGADVPYCVMGGTALSEGIGERLTPLNKLPACFMLVAKPHASISTKQIYESMRLDLLERRPDIDGMIQALNDGDIAGVAKRLENVMETVTVTLCPDIEAIKDSMKKNGALNAIMSGSGPTVFGLFEVEDKAGQAYKELAAAGLAEQIFIAKPVSNGVRGDFT